MSHLVQHNQYETLLLRNFYETPLLRNFYETPLLRKPYETPLLRKPYETLVLHNHFEMSFHHNSYEMPVLRNPYKMPPFHNPHKPQLLRDHNEMQSLRDHYETQLLRDYYKRQPLRDHYKAQLLHNQLEYETPLPHNMRLQAHSARNKIYKFVSISSPDESIMYKCSLHWDTRPHKPRIKVLSHPRQIDKFFYNFTSSLFSTTFKCSNLEYSFSRNFMRKHDHFNHWLEQHLNYISSCSYSYCVSRRKKKIQKKNRSESGTTSPSSMNNDFDSNNFKNLFCGGGRHQTFLNGEIICEHLHSCSDTTLLNDEQYFKGKKFEFKTYKLASATSNDESDPIDPIFLCKIPLHQLSTCLNTKELRQLSILHGIPLPEKITKKTMLTYFHDHHCNQCDLYISVFEENKPKIKIRAKKIKKTLNTQSLDSPSKFPPDPPSDTLVETIIREFCNETAPKNFVEGGCAVCGQLSPLKSMVLLNEIKCDLDIISPSNIGRQERHCISDPVVSLKGPILAENCQHVCQTCQTFLKKNQKPPQSLANSFWIGAIPSALQNMTFAEKMLISKIRHNKCLVRVSSGRAKMTANVIMFSNPTVKVYHSLPPSRQDISEVLAFVFQGPAKPTDDDIKRTPMLVRRNKVKDALEWLKLNHTDYEDLHISPENLNSYPLAGVPVDVEYSKSDPNLGNKIPTAMSIHDNEIEEGTTNGPCPFTVHGLTGAEFENMSLDTLKAKALQHLADNGSTLGISHDSKPQSMYDNPQAYPQMFPWLFPYGYGGIGQKCHFATISETTHKRNLLMYHDKRFQTDFYFPMIAFNHEQLKAGVTGSFLLAKRKKWPDISKRLKSLNRDVLKIISDKLSNGEKFTPKTSEEKACYDLLNDLDHVGGFVQGSITSKKHMRNEIWSMISHFGAPSWFITLSPADNRHPISLYYADKNIEFKPDLRTANERNLLVAQNPVAAARFFDLMIRMFIKHVLGVGAEHPGLYGDTAGYYGTVEQQGRLTLHLHTVLWIRNALSPQEIRDKLMNKDGEFQRNLIKYLEGCQKGEFLTGTMEDIQTKIPAETTNNSAGIHSIFDNQSTPSINNRYQDPTQTMPEEPPQPCDLIDHAECMNCQLSKKWWIRFKKTVDDILLRSNVHKCSSADGSKLKFKAKGCLNKNGVCKARFPRPIVFETTVNAEDGYINMKKTERMLNTISPCITYIFRCNTDVTSMLSGTTIKAVISYVTDYISKPMLKTHQIFATAYNVFDKNAKLEDSDPLQTDDARKLILKIVNALSSKMEIGSPMAAMYLLKNPDHYVSHKFIPFWWKLFVNDVRSSCSNEKLSDIVEERKHKSKFKSARNIKDLSEHKDNGFHDSDSDMNIDDFEINNNKMDIDDPMDVDIDDPQLFKGGGNYIPENPYSNKKIEEEQFEDSDNYDASDTDDDDNITNIEDDIHEEKLLISQCGNEYMASSKVDDYKYRPEAYENLSLYDWSILLEKKKTKLKKSDFTYLEFLPEHSQRHTHKVKCIPSRSKTHILNFIGGTLPRRDQGDFEYYCSTMLTLFKPWRKGKNLKTMNQTWAEAFDMYDFNVEHKKIMDNFNLRYECLDERDDYHAILKRQSAINQKQSMTLDQVDCDNDYDFGINSNTDEDYGDPNILGPTAIKKAQQMIETETMMKQAGWLDQLENPNLEPKINAIYPTVHNTGAQWKNIVKQCRENILTIKKINYSSTISKLNNLTNNFFQPLAVKLLPSEYFLHNFKTHNPTDQEIIYNVIEEFSLNKEQKRAFHIIANHASDICPQQLKMYLGGMGGTGKTQVIKALISMFNQRKQNHRFVVLAPTGTAAALLNGSTYHSVLGIRSSNTNGEQDELLRNEAVVIREVQERLEGVDYIFIDEVSMIACHELYTISSQLSKVTNEYDKPFGGKNIIFAGDFAQLPPTSGSPLYRNTVSQTQKSTMSRRDQESTIGKILWQQITTVVILTQNMRQTEMSEEDQKFRTALNNMRYAACTQDDLIFLKTLIVNKNTTGNKLLDLEFRNVSVITSLNTQKDQINDLGSERFSMDTGQKLTHFYSIDKRGAATTRQKKRGSKTTKKISASSDIPIEIQNSLWNSSPHSSEHFPGKLSLCLGMPVMIRNNDATELCITKGQEAFVVGWDSVKGPNKQDILETLYVKLKNPPKKIQLPHLPENIVPIPRTSKSIKCSLPNDYEINIIRQQVNVLPNFSMTDYASQGKTRLYNVVNLSHCKNFQSIYTCLSRGSSAARTLIIQGFNPKKIIQGLSGHLRQEFRELNLLNDITMKIYEGQISSSYFGTLRNPMIYKYQTEFQIKNETNGWHHALKWTNNERFIKPVEEDGTWNINIYRNLSTSLKNIGKNKSKQNSIIFPPSDKSGNSNQEKNVSAKSPVNFTSLTNHSPLGLSWDSIDYSCAYDSLFTVLHHMWKEGQVSHKAYFENGTQYLQLLHSKFTILLTNQCTFESLRDHLRRLLHSNKPSQYPFGQKYTNIDELIRDLTANQSYGTSELKCLKCTFTVNKQYSYLQDYTAVGWSSADSEKLQHEASVQQYLNFKIIKNNVKTNKKCPSCLRFEKKEFYLHTTQYINKLPAILMFVIAPWIEISKSLKFDVLGSSKYYVLKGIIYSNGNHFTARLIDNEFTIWYHDGQITRSVCQKEGSLIQMENIQLNTHIGGYTAIIAFYAENTR
jgi:hypothetical protein